MATIKDVAKRAKVSVATVSRVMGNKEHVTESARLKVEKAIKELNYQPNITARRLREQKTKSIIVIVPDINNTFFPEVFRGIEAVATQKGYRVWLEDMQNNPDIEREIFEVLPQKQVDGIISLTARTKRETIEAVAKQYPLVIAGQYLEDSKIPYVGISNIKASRDAVNHLIKLGHTNIAHISGPLNQLIFQDRLKGYESALERAGLKVDKDLVFKGNYTYESAFELSTEIIKSKKQITAIFAANDEMAAGVIKGIKAAGKRVPEDYAVIGFDNIRLAAIIEPAITTINQPKKEMGKRAIEMLFDLIEGRALKEERVVLKHSLVVRESCGEKVRD
ncbi:LacI family DNA-binding transcriptional regulator [Ohessyouella blattaphilus]|uniref:LacI family transcriptional regulator n=1 Tax=Ohessyouella blattaphilus TaxID=2949333 RepID=A0ABT1EKC5_9FIRM|nr:LacI family DNA-binding transcriptional regulator [Ohessyouella blattaphilus]MCP1111144.1 LacI family transcriptional regulator [Ohessyouella blattaphilus]MCR8564538.1 LacI family transcriptional regulator [Ohessyouella blattaphilus]